MSATYSVKGYIEVKIPIDDMYNCSQCSTPDEIAELVKWNLISKIGSCEILQHKFKLERIS